MVTEGGEFLVNITLQTVVRFSEIERENRINHKDVIDIAFGTMPEEAWKAFEAEGWAISAIKVDRLV